VSIAHTRWATHGQPSTTNSHPHVSGPDCEFTVVHNGIITNYSLLRDFLVRVLDKAVEWGSVECLQLSLFFGWLAGWLAGWLTSVWVACTSKTASMQL
jgi:predicted glutamine amidotransferase